MQSLASGADCLETATVLSRLGESEVHQKLFVLPKRPTTKFTAFLACRSNDYMAKLAAVHCQLRGWSLWRLTVPAPLTLATDDER